MEWFQQDHDGLGRPTMLSRQAVPGLALLVYDATDLRDIATFRAFLSRLVIRSPG